MTDTPWCFVTVEDTELEGVDIEHFDHLWIQDIDRTVCTGCGIEYENWKRHVV